MTFTPLILALLAAAYILHRLTRDVPRPVVAAPAPVVAKKKGRNRARA